MLILALAVALGGLTPSGAGADSLKEAWYLSRGKANMEIGNYKAAIEAFQEVVRLNPNHREAMRTLGVAYELQGLTDKAIEQFDRYLKRFPEDADIAFRQADYLGWSRYAYRKKDAIQYYRMGLKVRDDPEKRHKLARLLAEDKKTLDQAIEEYRKLIRDDPKNQAFQVSYRKLLLWDERHLKEAIREYERLAAQRPEDFDTTYQLAGLLARDTGRTGDAVKQYKKLVAKKPDNLALRIEYAKLMVGHSAYFDAAREELEYILTRDRRVSIRQMYADLLASRESTRDQALDQYRILVGQAPGDTRIRLKYARLLGARRETAASAVEQYQTVLNREPGNGEAHRGLAQAYAWLGYNDKALHHTRQALQAAPGDARMTGLKRTLMQGREPRVGSHISFVEQPGDLYGMRGYTATFHAQGDLFPFMTNLVEIGTEQYWNAQDQAGGVLFRLSLQYRLDPSRSVEGSFALHGVRRTGRSEAFHLQYNVEGPGRAVRLGFKRELKYDSLLSLAGGASEDQPLGAASANRFYANLAATHRRLSVEASPYAGWVSAASGRPNPWLGADVNAAVSVAGAGPLRVALTYSLHATHYARDHGGFAPGEGAPLPGGYFSPKLFLEQTPGILIRAMPGKDQEIELKGGPSFQFVREAAGNTSKTGAALQVSYEYGFGGAFRWTATAAYTQVADVYRRFFMANFIGYTFF
jgi:tetratricopeptide (TPR) repeat protein